MHVTGDRLVEHGLSTVGWDDEGVAAQEWDLIKDGVLVGYQLDRSMAALKHYPRSNGCAYADSAGHVPIQRMPNVSLQPDPDGPTTEALIAGVEHGLYVVGDKSWSIDMQRYNFQFTGQRFFRIESGRLAGQVKDVAYQATTTDFWGSMKAIGGPQTYLLAGRVQLWQGAAGPGGGGQPRLASGRLRGRPDPQHRPGRRPVTAQTSPQEVAERALAASASDGCVVDRARRPRRSTSAGPATP